MIFNIPVGGRATVSVTAYGAANETVTLTHDKGGVFTFKANDGNAQEIPVGVYTVTGSISKFSKTTVVSKTSAQVHAWPDGATIYYWYGYKPIGGWATIDTLPGTSPYLDNPVAPSKSEGANSVYFDSTRNYARGGTAYLPKTTIKGSTMTLLCSGATDNYYLALNLCPGFSWAYSPGAVKSISSGAARVDMGIEAVSGGSYHPAISMNTKRDAYDAKPSSITVYALYSI